MENKKTPKIETLLTNKKTLFDYEILSSFEAGIELFWYEVKSIKAKHINLKWSFITIRDWMIYLQKFHISPYKMLANKTSIDPTRERKLFIHKKDILHLSQKLKEKWFTLVPIEVYLKWNLIKVRIWLAKWKKMYEKKQILKERWLDKQAKIEASKIFKKF